jgi:tetratricopeptide (TPR) repeat protein
VAAVPPPLHLEGRELSDVQFLQAFAQERRTESTTCAERLEASGRRPTRNNSRKSRSELKAARRELVRGNQEQALQLLCSATAHFGGNVAAWQTLAELALNLGDADQARQAAERALKSKPKDATLLGILGDALALSGELTRSRALWRRSARVRGSGAARDRRLADRFGGIAARKLRSFSNGAALAYYRRAAVLSAGGQAPSQGMGEALRRLEQPEAARAWTERADRAALP